MLSQTQASILLGIGLQYKHLPEIEGEIGVGCTQLMALFNKALRRYAAYLRQIGESAIGEQLRAKAGAGAAAAVAALGRMQSAAANNADTSSTGLKKELLTAGAEMQKQIKTKQHKLLESLHLESYAIAGSDADWEANAAALAKSAVTGGTVAIKSDASKHERHAQLRASGTPAERKKIAELTREEEKKRGKRAGSLALGAGGTFVSKKARNKGSDA